MDDGHAPQYSRAPEPGDLIRLCRALTEAGARYVLIGGFAVIAHGAGRYTKDIDLLIDDAPENVVRVKRAMSVLADNAAADISETDIREFAVVRVADEILVDLMGRACGLSYADVVEDVEHLDLGGVVVPVASPATLIRTKHTHRPQDAIDCSFLEGVIRDRAAGR